MSVKVKIFQENSLKVLENKVNDFIINFKVIDMRVISITTSEKLFYVIVVFVV